MGRPTGGKNGRPRADRCSNGHTLTPDNRYIWRGQQKGCLACRRTNSDNFRRRRGAKPLLKQVVPAGPLLAFIEQVGLKEFARSAGTRLGLEAASIERQVIRARTRGSFTVPAADDLCVALDRHPVEVFGQEWFTYGAEVANAV